MADYMIKSGILLAVFYLFFIVVMRKETFFHLNRVYLLVGVVFSLLLPVMPSIRLATSDTAISKLIEGVSITNNFSAINYTKSSDLINPLFIIYLSGLSWFTLRFFSGLGKILYLYLRFPSTQVDGKKTIVIEGDHAPFTFFNILFISNKDLQVDKDESIIKHELAHIRQLHSIDLILLELAVIVQWFNPFIWLIKISLKAEHEYAADEQVMREGYNRLNYQQLLFERTLGVSAIGLVNNFNYSLLKNRIKMMTKNKSGANARMKYLFSIPMILLICVFTLTDIDRANAQDDQVYDQVEVMPEYPGGMQEVRMYIAQHLEYPEIAAEQEVSGKIFVQFTVYEDGSVQDLIIMSTRIQTEVNNEIVFVEYLTDAEKDASVQKEGILALEKEAIRVVSSIPDFIPGKQDGKPVKVRFTFPINFSLE